MSAYEEIATWLSASAANSSPNGKGNNLVVYENNGLYLQHWSTSGVTEKELIADGVKDIASLISDSKLFTVSVDDDILRHYLKANGSNAKMWSEMVLGAGNIKLHPKSQLCVLEDDHQTIIFHQDTNGDLATLRGNNLEWATDKLSVADPQAGTPLAFFPFNSVDFLFYVGKDDRIHRLVRDAQDADWRDEIFSDAKLENNVSKIVVVPSAEGDQTVLNVFGLSGNKLIMVTEAEEEPAMIGMMRQGEFTEGRCLIAAKLIGCLIGKMGGGAGIGVGGNTGGVGNGVGGNNGGAGHAGHAGCCVGAGSKTYNNYKFAVFQGLDTNNYY